MAAPLAAQVRRERVRTPPHGCAGAQGSGSPAVQTGPCPGPARGSAMAHGPSPARTCRWEQRWRRPVVHHRAGPSCAASIVVGAVPLGILCAAGLSRLAMYVLPADLGRRGRGAGDRRRLHGRGRHAVRFYDLRVGVSVCVEDRRRASGTVAVLHGQEGRRHRGPSVERRGARGQPGRPRRAPADGPVRERSHPPASRGSRHRRASAGARWPQGRPLARRYCCGAASRLADAPWSCDRRRRQALEPASDRWQGIGRCAHAIVPRCLGAVALRSADVRALADPSGRRPGQRRAAT